MAKISDGKSIDSIADLPIVDSRPFATGNHTKCRQILYKIRAESRTQVLLRAGGSIMIHASTAVQLFLLLIALLVLLLRAVCVSFEPALPSILAAFLVYCYALVVRSVSRAHGCVVIALLVLRTVLSLRSYGCSCCCSRRSY